MKTNNHGYSLKGSKRRYLYDLWNGIMFRCYHVTESSDSIVYNRYRGRGIRVASQWHDPRNFIADILEEIGERPSSRYSIDRIKNNGNYEPGNVRWAVAKTQTRNMSSNHYEEAFDTKLCLAEWAEKLDLTHCSLRYRLFIKKQDLEDIIMKHPAADVVIEPPPEIEEIPDYDDFELERYMHGKAGVSPEFMDANW